MNLQGWKAVARDAVIIYIFTFVLGRILNALWPIPIPPSSPDMLLRSGVALMLGIAVFAVIGFYTKERLWRHIFRIAMVLLVVYTIRTFIQINSFIPEWNAIMLFNTVWIPFVPLVIEATLGGLIARFSRGRRSRESDSLV